MYFSVNCKTDFSSIIYLHNNSASLFSKEHNKQPKVYMIINDWYKKNPLTSYNISETFTHTY